MTINLDPRQTTGEGFAFWIGVVSIIAMIGLGVFLLAGPLP